MTNKQTIESKLQSAVDAHKRGDVETAAHLYKGVIALDAQNVEARHLLAVALAQAGQHKDAENLLDTLSGESLEDANATRLRIAATLLNRGDMNNAGAYLEPVSSDSQPDPNYYAYCAFIEHYKGDLDRASGLLEKCVSLNRKNSGSLQGALRSIRTFEGSQAPEQGYQVIDALVSSRSSRQEGGPPGERVLLENNPQRRDRIRKQAGWNELQPGTLNLAYQQEKFGDFCSGLRPLFFEPGLAVEYPAGYQHIPGLRIGYWYYQACLSFGDQLVPVLVRNAVRPLSGLLEVFAPHKLRDSLALQDGDRVLVYMYSSNFSLGVDEKYNDAAEELIRLRIRLADVFLRDEQRFGRFSQLYQGYEPLGLEGQRPTVIRASQYRLEEFLKPDGVMLDIGCNNGFLGIHYSRFVSKYEGFDINPKMIEIADQVRTFLGIANFEVSVSTFGDFSRAKKYDAVIACAVHHWIDIPVREFAAVLGGLLNKGGILLLESNNLHTNDQDFDNKLKVVLDAGFKVLHSGLIRDDGVIERKFCVLRYLPPI